MLGVSIGASCLPPAPESVGLKISSDHLHGKDRQACAVFHGNLGMFTKQGVHHMRPRMVHTVDRGLYAGLPNRVGAAYVTRF